MMMCRRQCTGVILLCVCVVLAICVLQGDAATSFSFSDHVCEGDTVVLSCPPDYFLLITQATYRRRTPDICRSTDSATNVTQLSTCSYDVTNSVRDDCDGRISCVLRHDLYEQEGQPSSCPSDVTLYLSVDYRCDAFVRSALWCDNTMMRLECPTGYMIHIEQVFYGRHDDATCSGNRDHGDVSNTDCMSQEAMSVIASMCDYKPDCALNVSNVTLGEPCLGTFKYLRVNFTCLECVNSRSDAECNELATLGECSSNQDWMEAYCRLSCSQCDRATQCRDNGGDCVELSQQGHCRVSGDDDSFIARCPYSCNRCLDPVDPVRPPEQPGGLPARACVNLYDYESCEHWAGIGECVANPDYMYNQCYHACGCELPDWFHEGFACEGDTYTLDCKENGENTRIYVYDAWYGRDNTVTCPSDPPDVMDDVSCLRRVRDVTSAACLGMASCTITADSKALGDDCPDVHKYYLAYYTCRECVNARGDDALCDAWADDGECDDNHDWMHNNCFKSCSGCIPASTGPVSAPPDHQETARGSPGTSTPVMMETTAEPPSPTTPDDGVVTTEATAEYTTATAIHTGNRTVRACAGESVSLSCSHHSAPAQQILIWSVFYGRLATEDTCRSDRAVGECRSAVADDVIRREVCGYYNRRACSFVVGREVRDVEACSILDEPYVEIVYECTTISEMAPLCSQPCGQGVCVGVDVCVCPSGYAGSLCDRFVCDGVSHCSDHGTCVGANQCLCDDGWSGADCSEPDCTSRDHCNNHGRCVEPDRCWCYPFYTGESCEVCSPVFASPGPSCMRCPPCSQHGQCLHNPRGPQLQAYLGCYSHDVITMSHVVWRGEQRTTVWLCIDKCNALGYQYAGLKGGNECWCGNREDVEQQQQQQQQQQEQEPAVCDMTCIGASDEYEMCGGLDAYSVFRTYEGDCVCHDNWGGVLCDQCNERFTGDQCDQCAPRFTGARCDECALGFTGAQCNACALGFTGAQCNECALGFTGAQCDRCAPRFTGARCDECALGFTGAQCDQCSLGFTGAQCDQCAPRFTGALCNECARGFTGAQCDELVTTSAPITREATTSTTTQTTTPVVTTSIHTSGSTSEEAAATISHTQPPHKPTTSASAEPTSSTTPPTAAGTTAAQQTTHSAETSTTPVRTHTTPGRYVNPAEELADLTNFILTLEEPWREEYRDINSRVATEFISSTESTLHNLYSFMFAEFLNITITSLRDTRSLATIVQDLHFSRAMNTAALIDIQCDIWARIDKYDGRVTVPPQRREEEMDGDKMTSQLLVAMAMESRDQIYVCDRRKSYCGSDGELKRNHSSGELYCLCQDDASGERCDVTDRSKFITIVVVVIATAVPMIILLFVCCFMCERKQDPEAIKPTDATTSSAGGNPNRPTLRHKMTQRPAIDITNVTPRRSLSRGSTASASALAARRASAEALAAQENVYIVG